MGVPYNLPSPRQVTDAGATSPPPTFGQSGQEPTTPPPQNHPPPQGYVPRPLAPVPQEASL